jgi:hypothetical protein
MPVSDAIQKYKWFIVGGAVVLVLFVGFLVHNSVVNAGNKKQQDLIADYNGTTNVLSDCLVKTKQSVGAVNSQGGQLDKIITDAVRGRYTLDTTAKPGSGSLFSAIHENYPDLNGLSKTYSDVLVIMNGCRTNFRDSQSKLQADVSRFVAWSTGSFKTRHFGGKGYPNGDLEIAVNGKSVTGKAALHQMRQLVVVQDAQNGRDTGKIDNNDPFSGQ